MYDAISQRAGKLPLICCFPHDWHGFANRAPRRVNTDIPRLWYLLWRYNPHDPSLHFPIAIRVHVKSPGKTLRPVQSTFAKESAERQKRSQAIDGWKSRSGVWSSMGMAPPQMSQWEEEEAQTLGISLSRRAGGAADVHP
jgi:hypothetical protein